MKSGPRPDEPDSRSHLFFFSRALTASLCFLLSSRGSSQLSPKKKNRQLCSPATKCVKWFHGTGSSSEKTIDRSVLRKNERKKRRSRGGRDLCPPGRPRRVKCEVFTVAVFVFSGRRSQSRMLKGSPAGGFAVKVQARKNFPSC